MEQGELAIIFVRAFQGPPWMHESRACASMLWPLWRVATHDSSKLNKHVDVDGLKTKEKIKLFCNKKSIFYLFFIF